MADDHDTPSEDTTETQHWLGNVRDFTTSERCSMPGDLVESIEDLVAFLKEHGQPEMDTDKVMFRVLQAWMRRYKSDFPVPSPTRRLSFTVPTELVEQVDEQVEAKREDEPRAERAHLYAEAIRYFFGAKMRRRKDGLREAFEQWQQAQREDGESDEDGEPDEPEEAEEAETSPSRGRAAARTSEARSASQGG